MKSNGVACVTNHECGSNFCVDGVCCASNSCGTCMACNVSGSLGTCANVANNVTDPHARCTPGGTCGNTGACNGGGACQQQPTSVHVQRPLVQREHRHAGRPSARAAGSCPAAVTAELRRLRLRHDQLQDQLHAPTATASSSDYCTATSNGTCTRREGPGARAARSTTSAAAASAPTASAATPTPAGPASRAASTARHLLRDRGQSAGAVRPVHRRRDLRQHRPLQRCERLPAAGERRPAAAPPPAWPTPRSSRPPPPAMAAGAVSPRARPAAGRER